METARGRWFLAEFARRNRATDTAAVLDALTRLEAKLAASPQPAAAAVPSPPPVAISPSPVMARTELPVAPKEPPRIPEPDFSAVEQLFRERRSPDWLEPESTPAKPALDLDDEPWPPEADDPPSTIVASEPEPEEDPDVQEEDIEAWEAELTEMEQPAAVSEPEPPKEFSFFRKIETNGTTDREDEPRSPVIDPPRPIARAVSDWDVPAPAESRSIFPKPEYSRPAFAEIPRPTPIPPPVARSEPPRAALAPRPAPPPIERREPLRPASSLLDRLEPSRPVEPPPPAPRAERAPARPAPRVDDPTIVMTRDEKLAMFS